MVTARGAHLEVLSLQPDGAELAAVAFLARHSGRTLDAYRQDLRGFFTWMTAHEVAVLDATRARTKSRHRSRTEPVPAARRRPLPSSTSPDPSIWRVPTSVRRGVSLSSASVAVGRCGGPVDTHPSGPGVVAEPPERFDDGEAGVVRVTPLRRKPRRLRTWGVGMASQGARRGYRRGSVAVRMRW
jgi:hypothetical protein